MPGSDLIPRPVKVCSAGGEETTVVEVSPLATDQAIVDMARDQLEISPELFITGEVLP